MKFLIFTIIDPNLAENLTNFAEIVGPCLVYGVAFSNSKDPWSMVQPGCHPWSLVGPGCHQVSSEVVVRFVEGKSRVEALLNTAWYSEKVCNVNCVVCNPMVTAYNKTVPVYNPMVTAYNKTVPVYNTMVTV